MHNKLTAFFSLISICSSIKQPNKKIEQALKRVRTCVCLLTPGQKKKKEEEEEESRAVGSLFGFGFHVVAKWEEEQGSRRGGCVPRQLSFSQEISQ